MSELWRVGDLLTWTTRYFAEKGLPSARLEAELLLAHVLGQNRVWLYTHYDLPVEAEERKAYKEYIRRRLQGEPYAYITGSREFMSLELLVTRDVLIPRPDTETLVEAAIDYARREGRQRIVDVGTGSGAIAISLARYLPEAKIWATDISPAALAVARQNDARHKSGLHFVQADLLGHPDLDDFDLIVANLPYITPEQWARLEPGVRDYEPQTALIAEGDGLELYRRLLRQAATKLRPGGRIMLEIDPRQAEAARSMLGDYEGYKIINDSAGRARVVTGRKPMITKTFAIDPLSINEELLQQAAKVIQSGELLAFPTETVYGLGAAADNAAAIRKVFAVKGRPAASGLLVHISRPEQVRQYAADVVPAAQKLMQAFWPGPLAIILDAAPGLPAGLTGGRASVGFRMPDHPLALALLDKTGPLAAPSANLSGRPSPLTAEHVKADIEGKIAGILDGGATGSGMESTIIDLSGGKCELLRLGGLAAEAIAKVLGEEAHLAIPAMETAAYDSPVRVQLASSADDFDQMIAACQAAKDEFGLLLFMDSERKPMGSVPAYRMRSDARTEFYAILREAEAAGLSRLLCAPLEDGGAELSPALAERIKRAARSAE
ncbi:MAG: peptide chain release factor N(5)-glutamine methyltransferase [Syntrophomonadaceae bacterium]|nr:peptide chain release factor N(5)-glutamine methyltransferase [Syntrophomonadaceae bacterium]